MFYSNEFTAARNTTAEVFLPVEGFSDYEISNLGRVRSYKGKVPTILAGFISTSGYWMVRLYRNGQVFNRYVHRLVLFAFDGEPATGHEARHLDGDRLNPRLSNLVWGTPVENAADKVRHGTSMGNRPFTEAEVRDILLGAIAGETIRGQATRLGRIPQTVADVRMGKTHRHVAPEITRGTKNPKLMS